MMCMNHGPHAISRRGFAAFAAGAAAVGLLPRRGLAAGSIEALCIMCIDYRLVDSGVGFFDDRVGHGKYDIVALAGASLAGVSPNLFKPTVPGFWQQIDVARDLHEIRKVVVLDHMDCGAYKEEFNGGQPMPPDEERKKHLEMMTLVKRNFVARPWGPKGPPPDGIEFNLLTPVERIAI